MSKKDVSAVIVIDGDKFLILKRSDAVRSGRGFWNFPGGGVEKGESLNFAGARELKEEANITVDSNDLEYVGTLDKGHLLINYFITDKFSGEVKIDHESSDYAWISLDELDNYLFVGGGNIDPGLKIEISSRTK